MRLTVSTMTHIFTCSEGVRSAVAFYSDLSVRPSVTFHRFSHLAQLSFILHGYPELKIRAVCFIRDSVILKTSLTLQFDSVLDSFWPLK